MKVEMTKGGLLIMPETEFEADWMRQQDPKECFHKTGLTPADYLGIKIRLFKP